MISDYIKLKKKLFQNRFELIDKLIFKILIWGLYRFNTKINYKNCDTIFNHQIIIRTGVRFIVEELWEYWSLNIHRTRESRYNRHGVE